MVFGFRQALLEAFGIGIPTFVLEIFDIIVISLALGYVFKDFFKKPEPIDYDPLTHYKNQKKENFKFAIMVTAPAVVLHELGHKLVAMAFGVPSQLFASYSFLLLGIILKIMNAGIIFFVPGYVVHAPTTVGISTLISLAGPFVNLCLWLGSAALLKYTRFLPKFRPILIFTKKINMFLCLFNMIPVRPFDGAAIWNIFSFF
jgi:Zn-dependent protease